MRIRWLVLVVVVLGWSVANVGAAGSPVVSPANPTISVGLTQQFSVTGVTPVSAVAAGGFHTCTLLADGTVQCWGRNDYAQLGNGTGAPSATAVAVYGIAAATAVTAGGYHTCALLADGQVLCWGADDSGQLGDGIRTSSSASPAQVLGITTAVAVSAGGFHTCALLADGTIRCWGANDFGQLGNGTLVTSATPTEVPGIYSAIAITAGGYHTCALLADGSIRCWGRNDSGQLGNGTFTPSTAVVGTGVGGAVPIPTVVMGIATGIAVTGGFLHTCALLADRTARCWGWNAYGQLGDGTNTTSPTPVEPLGLNAAAAISASEWHTCALLSGGALECWGGNDYGQIGNGTTTGSLTPVGVAGVTTAAGITTGNVHTCALLTDGTVQCWGQNAYGQLGDGTTTQSALPVTVLGSRVTWTSGNTSVATIDASGLATGLAPGSTAITATSWGQSGATTLTVVP